MPKKEISEPYKVYLQVTVQKEGFHETFHGCIDLMQVEDPHFHELRLNYLNACDDLAEYAGLQKFVG